MANLDSKQYTLDDLSAAMADVNYAKGVVKEWENRAKTARAALQSHERETAKAQLEVDRLQKIFDEVLKGVKR